ncbi:MAG: hypothetical protein JNG83_06580 [Opitutaceae bacterium]|nr:hypothetical protein [Opitutaceae bacterium]
MKSPTFALLLACLLGPRLLARDAAPPSWLAGVQFHGAAAATWVDNISRTSHEPTRKDAATYELSLGAVRPRQLAPDWLLQLGADAEIFQEPDFDRNNFFRAGGRAELRRKFGLGPLAPSVRLEAGGRYLGARLPSARGWTAEAGFSVAKRLTPALRAEGRARWLEHFADGATFDVRQRSLGLEVAWDVTDRWSLAGSVTRLEGDIVANAAPAIWAQALSGALGPVVAGYYNTVAWEVTDLYGPGWVSYNVAADVDLWSLTLAYAATPRLTVELRAAGAYVINRIDVRYPTDSAGLGVRYRF